MSVVSNTSLEYTLREGANALGLDLWEAQITQLLDFLALLQKWNKVYNLTAVRDPQEMLTHHLLDSLAAVPPLRRHVAQRGQDSAARPGARLLDVGSGGGLPGVVFAICCPEVDVSCVDTVAKKAAFIQQAAGTLGLSNLHGIHARVETLAGPFDVVSCRAFAALADFTAWSRQALAPHGVWLAMKGKHPHDEIAALPADVSVFHVEQLTVPGLQAERCILWLRPVA
ncbi:16S rRNA (guanine(527)-N(7))-methyltransferase [Diaphorobacter nitroreducens]|uniref:16S rRNA (guanine(527)-N(7))-methyltransferase RsmG n=1 Tax=Diaphorobacter nitroreducens TaxID=164759 RepID=UPI000B59E779|nr:16S rRNA (guanine(527)-N(7))-methyltransferase RsmG [Diaphorobacter nitroreducens]ASI69677.1 16S rRNA (guanine(527)-N(7))-methyltransferase [Diaphorobacter nitroreducens]